MDIDGDAMGVGWFFVVDAGWGGNHEWGLTREGGAGAHARRRRGEKN